MTQEDESQRDSIQPPIVGIPPFDDLINQVRTEIANMARNNPRQIKRLSKLDLFGIALFFSQYCINTNISAEQFTSTFIHLYSQLKSIDNGIYSTGNKCKPEESEETEEL